MMGSSIAESLFQRTLDDLIKGFRLNLLGESVFISKALDEIRREIKSTDLHTKSAALQKLTYLHSIHGVDMSWASFRVVEVLSSPRFSQKKIGYMAASLSFSEATDVLLLMTNQLRKDLTSTNQFEASLALEFIAHGTNTDLSRDLTPEIFTLLSTTKIPVRKKAIAALLKLFDRYPDSVKTCFKKLVENLETADPSILSVTVGVFCDIIHRDPSSYLPLAPEFYRILVDSKNNWVLIKVVKIFSNLLPLEPRLGNKIVECICDITRRTTAKSLMFECVQTITTALTDHGDAIKLAASKIQEMLTDDDSNLRYLGLRALSNFKRGHGSLILENRDSVIRSLSDEDRNIRIEGLHLMISMISPHNVSETSRVLIGYAVRSDSEFCNGILSCILATCSRNSYEVIEDFDWYASLLCEMARVPNFRKAEELETQIVDICMRVTDARPRLVSLCRDLLIDPSLLGNPSVHRVLAASAWVSGHYVPFSRNPNELIESLVQPRTSLLPPSIRAVYIHSLFKALLFCLHRYVSEEEEEEEDPKGSLRFSHEDIAMTVVAVEAALFPLLDSDDVEVLERSRNVLGFIAFARETMSGCFGPGHGEPERTALRRSEIIDLVRGSFSAELGPISAAARERVPLPEGLDLEENLDGLDSLIGPLEMTVLPSGKSPPSILEYRQRYPLYYLPSEKNDDRPIEEEDHHRTSDSDLAKLAEESLLLKRSKPVRPRPTVVKLEEVEVTGVGVEKPGDTESGFSEIVRDVLKGKKPVNGDYSNISSYKGKGKLNVDGVVSTDTEDRRQQRKAEKKKRKEKKKKKVKGENVYVVECATEHGPHKGEAFASAAQIPDLLL